MTVRVLSSDLLRVREINILVVIDSSCRRMGMPGERGVAQPPRSLYSVCELDIGNHRARFAEHLDQILASTAFRNSKRYAAVLRYVVERALEGNLDRLKERTIGVDVFGWFADYDTAYDHAVRSGMAEVRKRLAQYYQEDNSAPLRIEIQPGSYIPQFRQAGADDAPAALETEHLQAQTATPPARRRWNRIVMAAVVMSALATLGVRLLVPAVDPVSVFWGPILSSTAPILLCVGNLEGGQPKQPASAPEPPAAPLTMRAF